jgi:Asp-tRNA(Asn)/Glu-tRNA(Gln) amidotransferase A subunit family amidase
VRAAAQGLKSLGASLEPVDEVWEDFFPGIIATGHLFRPMVPGPAPQRPSREAWTAAMDLRQRNWTRFRALFRDYDLLISPTTQLLPATMEDWAARWGGKGPRPFPHQAFAPHYTSHTHMFNWLGFPAVSVPAGFVDGLPVGLQIVGWPGSDAKVLRAAQAFSKAYPRPERPPIS